MIKAKYLLINVDNRDYYRVVRAAIKGVEAKLKLPNTQEHHQYIEKLKEPNEFIRISFKHYYADLHFKNIIIKESLIIIYFSKIIDYNNTKFIPDEKK